MIVIRTWRKILNATCEQLTKCQEQIDEIFSEVPQSAIYTSQPGVGKRIGPRLAIVFGSKPQVAFKHKNKALAYLGQSPLTKQSGNTKLVPHIP